MIISAKNITKISKTLLLKYAGKVQHRRRPITIIVTGSMGKTTTHFAVSQLLSAKYKMKVVSTNDNNGRGPLLGYFGMSLPQRVNSKKFWAKSLFRAWLYSVKFPYEVVVLEISDSAYGSLKDFLAVIQPEYCVVTGVAKVHMEKFKNKENLLEDMQSIASTAEKVLYNADFPELCKMFSKESAVGYGIQNGEIRFLPSREESTDTLTNVILYHEESWLNYKSNFVASHALYSQTAAAYLARELGMSRQEITLQLSKMRPVKARLNPLKGINNSLIIDDTYNANAESMIAAVAILKEFPLRNRVAVLGSINELGGFSKEEHERVAKEIVSFPSEIYIFGADALRYLYPMLIKSGYNKEDLHTFATARQAGTYLSKHLAENSVIVAKGSQNDVFAEEAIKPILLSLDQTQLIRQSEFWQNKKTASFEKQEALWNKQKKH